MRLAARLALVVLIGQNLVLGVWATFAPRQWFDTFPGGGRTWVSIDGPYNEHLVRDVGAAVLAVGLLALWAAIRPERLLLGAAGAANAVFGLPHVIYHLRHLGVYANASDKVASAGGLVFTTACALFVVFVAVTSKPTTSAAG